MRNLLGIGRFASVIAMAGGVAACIECRGYVEIFPGGAGATSIHQLTLMVGDTVQLVAQGKKYFGDGECSDGGSLMGPNSSVRPDDYAWASSAPAVAKALPDGRVVALSPGDASVVASVRHESAEDAVMPVIVIPRLDSVTVEPLTATVFAGDTISFRINEWAGGVRLPVRFPGVIDPHLREAGLSRTVNLVRTDPARVLLRAETAGTTRLHVWSLTYRYDRVPQDTATLVIQPR